MPGAGIGKITSGTTHQDILMKDLLNLTFEELTEFMQSLGEPGFRARQVWEWLWHKGVDNFEAMSNVSKATRSRLAEAACIVHPELELLKESSDGTKKLLLKMRDGALVETVLIPSESQNGVTRMTQCISVQVGCAMGCTFCSTGQMGFTRNLSMAEILGQVLVARKLVGDPDPARPIIRNIVFMGMGEPLLNFNELMRSLETLNSSSGLAFSPRRLTVSTCGLEKGLLELGESGLAYLAVSLHAPNQALRERLMPKAARWPLDKLIDTLASYPLRTRERLTFEYLLLGGVNDSVDHARELIRLMSRLKAKLNLIVYNPVPGLPYKAPGHDRVLAFEQQLWAKGVTAILRKSKGQDINAACGQLRAEHVATLK